MRKKNPSDPGALDGEWVGSVQPWAVATGWEPAGAPSQSFGAVGGCHPDPQAGQSRASGPLERPRFWIMRAGAISTIGLPGISERGHETT